MYNEDIRTGSFVTDRSCSLSLWSNDRFAMFRRWNASVDRNPFSTFLQRSRFKLATLHASLIHRDAFVQRIVATLPVIKHINRHCWRTSGSPMSSKSRYREQFRPVTCPRSLYALRETIVAIPRKRTSRHHGPGISCCVEWPSNDVAAKRSARGASRGVLRRDYSLQRFVKMVDTFEGLSSGSL